MTDNTDTDVSGFWPAFLFFAFFVALFFGV